MAEQNRQKLNRLLAELGDADMVSARWLRGHGYSTALVAGYVKRGWLRSPARGVYMAAAGLATWEGALHSLQQREQLRLHAGARFALALHGHEHYLRVQGVREATLYGPDRLPGWATALTLDVRFMHGGLGPFPLVGIHFSADAPEDRLRAEGLERLVVSSTTEWVVVANPERAMLELCHAARDAADVHEAHATMQGMSGLRPWELSGLLRRCQSIKAKRLFLALADRANHAWLEHLELESVDLGRGKRAFFRGGRIDARYQITLPADLESSLG
ncbi:type IV toxin-antitoxin system AbiEi family antitoxin domain-containing protein [Arenimonas sp.]|uniref:type IV toxin-antitoxin system AbiEi family antitoxin domain-containing protein n=1 Tax=Arenimonas sp. TaxID=1872635 RepID=UPI002E34D298|nr:type IV toxin-antitoxin system AbiEi family antitoxin domain-containing protein [Arenimonas sp.]HEX4854052.1 type IV toxin-antitoxin system AbiEi family antitoxin domain-containing protein [Arenimonas sp.]